MNSFRRLNLLTVCLIFLWVSDLGAQNFAKVSESQQSQESSTNTAQGSQPVKELQTQELQVQPNPQVTLDSQPATDSQAEQTAKEVSEKNSEYLIGIDDILEIQVIRPEAINLTVTVSPDGSVAFPYIGVVVAKDKTPSQIQGEITSRLAEGYMKYPVVNVILKESRSRRFFVYGEVVHPGAYPIEQNTTVMRAISMAGGFTKFGSSSRVKVLRVKKGGVGYDPIKINIKDVMNGSSDADISIHSGDIIVIAEGIF